MRCAESREIFNSRALKSCELPAGEVTAWDVKLTFGGTVGEKAKSELHEIRHLVVGRQAQQIQGDDQDGKHFKLSDYRGRVVLLYFWSEY
jgi:hypothetical protein